MTARKSLKPFLLGLLLVFCVKPVCAENVKPVYVKELVDDKGRLSLSSVYPELQNSDESVSIIEPFTFAFSAPNWNLLVEPDLEKEINLAGWQSESSFSIADSFDSNILSGDSSASLWSCHGALPAFVSGGSGDAALEDGLSENYEGTLISSDGNNRYHYREQKNNDGEFLVARSEHDVKNKAVIDTKVLVLSKTGVGSGFYTEDSVSSKRSTQVEVSADVGKFRVWGEFQMNDWNGLDGGSNSGVTENNASLNSTSAALTKSVVDSSFYSPVSGGIDNSDTGNVVFEVGAAFPVSKATGAIRYRKSYDDKEAYGGYSREHYGFEGEVRIENDVYLKAGYELINSMSSVEERKESNLWTGIKVNF